MPTYNLPMNLPPSPEAEETGTGDLTRGITKAFLSSPTFSRQFMNNAQQALQGTPEIPEDRASYPAPALPAPSVPHIPGGVGALFVTPETRAAYPPSPDNLNVSMDFNAVPGGGARGTEVVIPNNASPVVRAAAEEYNRRVVDFAATQGIMNYPNRGVRTRAENKRGVPNTVHTEPFFTSDTAMSELVQSNPAVFSKIYEDSFGGIPGARLVAPHGVGADRGAASDVFGDETSFGELMALALLNQSKAQ